MLQLNVPAAPAEEMFDESTQEFVIRPSFNGATIQLEHSLVSISKWESKWHKAYLNNKEQTPEEFLDYIRCMTLTKDVKPEVYDHLTVDNIKQIQEYITNPMSATVIKKRPGKGPSRKIITSEVIYSWMIDNEIPFSCEKWHLNRLMMLLQVCGERANPGKKMSKKSILKDNAALNAARRKQMGSLG